MNGEEDVGIASNIVRAGCSYVRAAVKELELDVEEERWEEAYRQAQLVQRLLRKQRGAIQQALWSRLSAYGEAGPPEFGAWLIDNRQLLDTTGELETAVHDRDPAASKALLARLALFLVHGLHETIDVVVQIEALTGDLSDDLGASLHQGPSEGR